MLLGLAGYGVSLAVLWRNPSFGHQDAITELIIFGLVFPLLAWITTLRAQPLTLQVRRSSGEKWLLFGCLIGVMFYLVWGTGLSELFVPLNWLAAPRLKFLAPTVIVVTGGFGGLGYSSDVTAMSRAPRRSKMGLHTLLFLPKVIEAHAPMAAQSSITFALAGALLLLIVSARYNRRTQF